MSHRPRYRLLFINGLLLLCMVGGFAWSRSYWRAYFRGPEVVDDQYLLTAGEGFSPGDLVKYVELRDHPLIDTGRERVTKQGDRVISTDRFFVTPVGERFLLVMAESPEQGRLLVGPLYRPGTSVEAEILAEVDTQEPQFRGRLLPVMLNAKAVFRMAGHVGLAVFTPLLLVTLVNVVRGALSFTSGASDE